ncbi:MAG: EpiH/GdmH-related protein [Acidimicrobiales bacterium]|nr:EpiH/GdmH-related protein [Acidimicrobiales bacterium]
MRRIVRIGVKVAALVVTAVLVYLGVTFVQVWLASRRDDVHKAQAIVVFGAAQYNGRPSAVLRARLDHAAALYMRKLAPVVVVTGGRQPGDRFTEATASADYLHTKGVPDTDILREVSGHSSWQSLASAAGFLKVRNITDVILVSDPFHSLRITNMAAELGLHASASPTRTSPIGGFSATEYMGRETLAVAAGRLVGFRREAGVKQVVTRR